MSYAGLNFSKSAEETLAHLGGNIKEGDPFTFSPLCWEYLISRFQIRSVMDVGSGLGYAASWFHRRGLETIAVEGFEYNVVNSKYPSILCDLTKGFVKTRVDLVHCQEVLEHIEEEYIDNLMKTLSCGAVVVVTHALPGQGGHHHVNCQPPEYWVDCFKKYGYHLLEEDTKRIRVFAERDNARYLRATGMVFHRNI